MKRREFLKAASLGVAAGTMAWAGESPSETLLLTGGNIITSDPAFTVAPAMAIRGNRILAVGAAGDVSAAAGKDARVIDLEGKTVLPGLIDSHLHPVMAADYEFDHEVPDFETLGDVLSFFRSRAEILPEGEWIGIDYMFITRLRDRRYPTREELDRVSVRHPVYFNTGPDMVLNTAGLQRLGFLGGTPVIGVGRVETDSRGNPTGLLRKVPSLSMLIAEATKEFREKGTVSPEKAPLVSPALKLPSAADRRKRLARQLSFYNSAGFTTVSPRDEYNADIALWQELYTGELGPGSLTCRCPVMMNLDQGLPIEGIRARLDEITGMGLSRTSDEFWLQGIKFYMDGGMLTGSARFIEPYGVSSIYGITDPEYRGILFADAEKTAELVSAVFDYGLQPTAHAVGDEAVKTLAEAYIAAARQRPIAGYRPCLSHANFVPFDLIPKIAEHGIALDMQPAWLYMDGATLLAHFGQERLAHFQPYRTLIDAGVHIGGGSDHMLKMEPERSSNLYSPFLAMETMLTRRPRWTGEIIHPEQITSREEAVRFYTNWNAWLLNRENAFGSLEAGKYADFILIDRDILTCPVETIAETVVLETWLDGKPVWKKES
ncbi:MAG: amidohydrolase [Thermoguttaceae bacterium]|nr:amidohydrolase [Thermoguttaceae bacterium]